MGKLAKRKAAKEQKELFLTVAGVFAALVAMFGPLAYAVAYPKSLVSEVLLSWVKWSV